MKLFAILAITVATLAGCAQLSEGSAAGGTFQASAQHPDWLRDPARSEYPYNARGW